MIPPFDVAKIDNRITAWRTGSPMPAGDKIVTSPDAWGKFRSYPEMLLSLADFRKILVYQASIPSGHFPGKMWRHCVAFGDDPTPLVIWLISRFEKIPGNDTHLQTVLYRWMPTDVDPYAVATGGPLRGRLWTPRDNLGFPA
jgi:hypothetical protein